VRLGPSLRVLNRLHFDWLVDQNNIGLGAFLRFGQPPPLLAPLALSRVAGIIWAMCDCRCYS
jgi:hypothetical protein